MSPVSPRPDLKDPNMFPVSYPSLSTSTSSPFPQVPTSISSSGTRVTFDASTIVVLLSFLVFTLWVVAIFLFAPSLRLRFNDYRAKRKQACAERNRASQQAKKEKKQIRGLGFGYDGLSQAEFEALMQKEEEDGQRSFVRSPRYPPSLSAIQPLPPITIPAEPDVQEARGQVHTQPDSDSDPAPLYERGDYDSPGSKCDSKWARTESNPQAGHVVAM